VTERIDKGFDMNMNRRVTGLIVVLLAGGAFAQDPPAERILEEEKAAKPIPADEWKPADLLSQDTLTNDWFTLGETMVQQGVTVALGVTQIYQIPLQGGGLSNSAGQVSSLHRHKGRYTGSYDFEIELDLEKLVGLTGGRAYALAEGGWSAGLDRSAIGSLSGVNDDAMGDEPVMLTELWYEQAVFDNKLLVRLGKVDLTGGFDHRNTAGCFDGNRYANDETAQFLSGALVNNPAIPFPDNGLGVIVQVNPVEWLYLSAGAADARADSRETGFNTAFHQQDDFFGIWEFGLSPQVSLPWGTLQGIYRAGFWYDPQPKERFKTGSTKRDDMGFYLSFDQDLYRENDTDQQGLGAFFRYGWADGDVNDLKCFWSAGMQYQGLLPTRDNDVLGVGVGVGKVGDNPDYTAGREWIMETYYNAQITPWLNVTPNIQFIKNPGADADIPDATVMGCRVQLLF
jgi:porin